MNKSHSMLTIYRNSEITFKTKINNDNLCKIDDTNVRQSINWKIFNINDYINSYKSKFTNV